MQSIKTKDSAFAVGAFDIIIGIDPDVERSGFAVLDVKRRAISVSTLPFPELVDAIRAVKKQADLNMNNVRVVLEAGYLKKGNWHLKPMDSKSVAAAKGRNVGMNHQTGVLICEMCRHLGMTVSEAAPLVKIWRGRDRKITHAELVNTVGQVEHTNQDGRDAALLAWVSAGLPINI